MSQFPNHKDVLAAVVQCNAQESPINENETHFTCEEKGFEGSIVYFLGKEIWSSFRDTRHENSFGGYEDLEECFLRCARSHILALSLQYGKFEEYPQNWEKRLRKAFWITESAFGVPHSQVFYAWLYNNKSPTPQEAWEILTHLEAKAARVKKMDAFEARLRTPKPIESL